MGNMALRRRAVIALAVVTMVGAMGIPVIAQTLADAARLAEEQRKAETRPSVHIGTDGGFPLREILLDDIIVLRFVNARDAVNKLLAHDRVLYDTIHDGGKSIERFRDFAKVLAIEPKVVETLRFFGLDPEIFVLIEATMRRAVGRGDGTVSPSTGVEHANTVYMETHKYRIGRQYNYYRKVEEHWFWPESVRFW